MADSQQSGPRRVVQSSWFDVRFQETLLAGIAALIGWNIYTSNENAKLIAGLAADVRGLSAQVAILQESTRDRYTRQDAARDYFVRDELVRALTVRVEKLETGK